MAAGLNRRSLDSLTLSLSSFVVVFAFFFRLARASCKNCLRRSPRQRLHAAVAAGAESSLFSPHHLEQTIICGRSLV